MKPLDKQTGSESATGRRTIISPAQGILFILGLCMVLALILGYGFRWVLLSTGAEGLLGSYLPPGTESSKPDDVGNTQADAFYQKIAPPLDFPAQGWLEVTDSNFATAYDEIYDKRQTYYGRDIRLAGFVLHQEGLGPGEYLIGRYLLWCCEEDMYFIGFLASGDGPLPPEHSRWSISGTIEARNYIDPEKGTSFKVPSIRVQAMEGNPDLPLYIFPGGWSRPTE